LEQLTGKLDEKKATNIEEEEKEDKGSEHETDEDEEDEDYLEILPEKLDNKYKKGPRSSVSAEAFGVYNKKEDFVAKVIEKS